MVAYRSVYLKLVAVIIGSFIAILILSRPVVAYPSFSNVFIVMEENHSYSQILGNPLMPYLNMLINNGALATQYFANQHHSLPNYLWITSGSNDGINVDTCTPVITSENAITELNRVGVSWKTYQQGLPYVGYLGCESGYYHKRHNPLAYYKIVIQSSTQRGRIVPLTQLATDLANDKLARYNFITPDICDDMHSDSACTNGCVENSSSACWTAADKFLQTEIGPLLATNMFQPGGHGLLIITFDESVSTDTANGGGHVAWVAVSPLAKPGYRSTRFYQHPSTLRLMLEGLGVTKFPNASATAPDMSEFFN
jgi:phosphatidylinositol-3-phosphatase